MKLRKVHDGIQPAKTSVKNKAAKKAEATENSKPATTSYSMVEKRFKDVYFRFYAETYRNSGIDRKTKELIAIAASLTARCQGCLEGHIKKAIKLGATPQEIGETIAIAMGIGAAAVVDLTDTAARNLNLKLFQTQPSQEG